MTDEPALLLALAREDLAVAQHDLDGGFARHAVSRSYYAAFHAAQAALHREGIAPKSHKGTLTQFAQVFVRPGTFSAERGRVLAALHQLRHDADYETGRAVAPRTARAALADAEAFVDDVAAWLDRR